MVERISGCTCNTGPLGCLPQQLATTATGDSDFDKHGCLNSLNNAAISFN